MQYPPAIKVLQLPCTGRIDVFTMLRAFEDGVDGIFVAGWLPGDCHYLEGNVNAKRRIGQIQDLLTQIGLGAERVQMCHISAAMAGEFARRAQEMSDKINALGPNPLKNGSVRDQSPYQTQGENL